MASLRIAPTVNGAQARALALAGVGAEVRPSLARVHRDDEAIETLEQVTAEWPEDLRAQQMLVKLLEAKSQKRR